jgi:hypothetical protein
MKLFLRRITPTSERASRVRAAGSITLEAALVMPIFMLTVVFLVFLIRTSVTAMALHGALSQTVRQAAAAWYPISLAADKVRSEPVYKQTETWSAKLEDIGRTLSEYGDLLPSPLSEWARQAADGSWSIEQTAARAAFEEWLKTRLDGGLLDEDRLRVVKAEIPSAEQPSGAFITVEAEYRLPFKVPFVGRTLVLRQSARERAWVGGQPSAAKLAEDGAQPSALSFVSLSPNPVARGRKATLTLRAEPGQTVYLTVVYKSGESQARNLGMATADERGIVSWTWHVSGNTTPGTWFWEAKSEGREPLTQMFEVAAKSQANGGG